jgi:hypothetical protein
MIQPPIALAFILLRQMTNFSKKLQEFTPTIIARCDRAISVETHFLVNIYFLSSKLSVWVLKSKVFGQKSAEVE